MKQTFTFLLILTLFSTLFSGCSSEDDAVVPASERGLWISESEITALNEIEDDVAAGFSPAASCDYFAVFSSTQTSFEINAIDVHRSGAITPTVVDEAGILGLNYEIGAINSDGSYSENIPVSMTLGSGPSGLPTEIEFLGSGVLVFSNFYINSFGVEEVGTTYYRQTSVAEVEAFNEILTDFCR